ncbi:MAG: 2-hydroxyacid dehydrogenase [Chthoniobacteraceae bacterium]
MKVAVFSTKSYDREFLAAANAGAHDLHFLDAHLDESTAVLAAGYDAICVFVNDAVNAPVLAQMAAGGTRLIALRCAGFNNVDLPAAARRGMAVVRVPAYSPHSVAEHTIGLILALNRQLHRAYNRVREGNFALDGLLGFDLRGRIAGLIGTGQIGAVGAKLLRGFDCEVLAFDPFQTPDCLALGVRYVPLDELFKRSDIISLHCPLLPENHHIIDASALARMKTGAMLINTSRGALIDTLAVIDALKSGQLGYLGLDVYEEEGGIFFEDLSSTIIRDDVFMRLLTFPNVLITGHQAFFTRNALEKIASTTIANMTEFELSGRCANQLVSPIGVHKS